MTRRVLEWFLAGLVAVMVCLLVVLPIHSEVTAAASGYTPTMPGTIAPHAYDPEGNISLGYADTTSPSLAVGPVGTVLLAITSANSGFVATDEIPQVTEGTIRSAMQDAPLQSQQGAISIPRVQNYVDRLAQGDVPPAIKVDGNIIVDGNHRYIAGRIFGQEPPQMQWPGGNPDNVVPWGSQYLDTANWGN